MRDPVTCSRCGTENRPDRKFCANCGARLALVCANCDTSNLPDERFCGECGTPLPGTGGSAAVAAQPGPTTAPASAASAERRQVTVLFADLVGFTTISEGRDPEAVRELLTAYFDAARGVIERYGGTVEKFIGDAVMAVWGAPTAREDDAERAVRAALDLVDAVAALRDATGTPELSARAAALTGEAAVTIGADGQGLVAGDLVNTAARLQSVAEPGTVLVGEATQRSARDAIEFEAVGQAELRGKALPVAAWRALRVVAGRGGAGRAQQVEGPFIGRQAELRELKDALDAAGRDGRARFVLVVGQGGIGKSRLAWELEKYVDGLVETIRWHRGRAPAYGDGLAFWSIGEMVRERARISETDDPAQAASKLAATVAEHIADLDDRRWVESHLRVLLGLSGDATGDRAEQFAAWRRFFEAVAAQHTTVLLFEDLHWADLGTLEFIDSLLEWSRRHPLLVIGLARPELLERRPTIGQAGRDSRTLHLEPLSDDDVRSLLTAIEPDLAPEVLDAVVARAQGVPLFAIELLRMLRDDPNRLAAGKLELTIPPSLRALIAARLDALEPRDRAFLQDVAVLGQTFTVDAATAVTGLPSAEMNGLLTSLVRREFLRLDVDPRSPERGQYGWVQGVVREVAYGTLARADRRARHVAAARYFEGLGDEELAGVLASHYVDAYRALPEDAGATAIRAQARLALRGAAERAARLHSYDQALKDLASALELTDDRGERAAILERLAQVAEIGSSHQEAVSWVKESREAYEAVGDREGVARATARLGGLELKAGRNVEARALLLASYEQLAEGDDPRIVAELAAQIGRLEMLDDRGREALAWTDRALEAAAKANLPAVIAEAMNTRGTALANLSRIIEGTALIRGAVRIAEDRGLTAAELRARYNLGGRLYGDDPKSSLREIEAGLDVAVRAGNLTWQGPLVDFLALSAAVVGEFDTALRALDSIPVSIMNVPDRAGMLMTRALITCTRGDKEAADQLVAEAFELLRGTSSPGILGGNHVILAQMEMLQGRDDAAEERIRAHVLSTEGWAAPAWWNLCRIAIARRDTTMLKAAMQGSARYSRVGRWVVANWEAQAAALDVLEGRVGEGVVRFRDQLRVYRDLDVTLFSGFPLLDFVRALGPDAPETQAFAEEARAIFERLGSPPLLARLDEALAGRPAGATQPAAARATEAARP